MVVLLQLVFFVEEINIDGITLTAGPDSLQIFVARFDASGNVVWAKECGGIYDDIPVDIAVDDNGNVYITGNYRGEAFFSFWFVESDFYEGTTDHSYDIFISKLNPNGSFAWVKSGSSNEDNRGMALDISSSGKIYLAAQISDTITFDVTHNNEVLNAGAVVAFNSSASELWFERFYGNETLPYDLKITADDKIRVLGDYSGVLTLPFSPPQVIFPDYDRNVFLFELNEDASLNYATDVGSDNALSGRAMTIGSAGETYLTGTFCCKFSQLNDTSGAALFNALGFDDIWTARYENDGAQTWYRHFGGPGDDFCSGIAYRLEDRPIVAGSYSAYFHVPGDNSFLNVSLNYLDIEDYPPNQFSNYCGFSGYGDWRTVEAVGQSQYSREIFLADAVLLSKGPLDFYRRQFNLTCAYNEWEPCVFPTDILPDPLDCIDSSTVCLGSTLKVQHFTGTPGIFAPTFLYNWNTGEMTDSIIVVSTDLYTVDISRADGCGQAFDSVQVTVNGLPDTPSISDEFGINVNEIDSVLTVHVCEDTVMLWGGNICNTCSYYWSGGGSQVDTALFVTQDDLYTFHVIDSIGCEQKNKVYVDLDEPFNAPIVPLELNIYQDPFLVNQDTAFICPGDHLDLIIEPNNIYSDDDINLLGIYYILLDGDPFDTIIGDWDINFFPQISGLYEITADPQLYFLNLCGDSLITWPSLYQWVYIEMLEAPIINFQYSLSASEICPGDSALLVLSGADIYELQFGPSITEYLSLDSMLLTESGDYLFKATSISADGCEVSEYETISLIYFPTPLAWTTPDHGVVCPGDSVLITREPGLSYQWIGPLSDLLDNSQSIYTTTPGQYYAIHEAFNGCITESNIVETYEYSSPFLEVFPSTEICFTGSINIDVISNLGADIWWEAPLSSDSPTVTLTEGGTYNVSSTICGITTELEITLTDSSVPAQILATDSILCPSETTEISIGPGDFMWEWLPSGSSASTITIDDPGTYILNTWNLVGCQNADTLIVTGELMPSPTAENSTICLGDTVSINATAGTSIWWSTSQSGFPIDQLGPNYIDNDVQSSYIIYAFAGDSACYSDGAPVFINVDPVSSVPSLSITGMDCTGASATFDAPFLTNATYLWLIPSGDSVSTSSFTLDSISVGDIGDYSLVISNNECTGPETIIPLNVIEPGPVSLTTIPTNVLCEEDLLILSIVDTTITNITWGTPAGTMYNTSIVSIMSTNISDNGIYYVTGSDSLGCTVTGQTAVSILQYPNISLDSSTVYCDNNFLVAVLPSIYTSYDWSNGSMNSSIEIDDTGWWSVTVGNGDLCYTTDSIYIDDDTCLDAPINVFSPNGDSMNDEMDFRFLGMNISEVQIFNRAGNSIRTLNGPFQWDGQTDNGKMVSEGVYYWVIISNEEPLEHMSKTGYVHLFR